MLMMLRRRRDSAMLGDGIAWEFLAEEEEKVMFGKVVCGW
jgi:hypothetical protein